MRSSIIKAQDHVRSKVLALSRSSYTCGGGHGHGHGNYVDLLITRFSLAFGGHAKIAFTARAGAPTLHLAARPHIVRVGGTTSFSPMRVLNTRFRARISASSVLRSSLPPVLRLSSRVSSCRYLPPLLQRLSSFLP